MNNQKNRTEILIVEDSPTQALKLRKLFEGHGYETRVAANGQEALHAARGRRPTLIIADIIMPVMDGYEMCRAIKCDKALKDIPVMLLTTLSHSEDIIQGLDVRADYYVTKPYKDNFLLSKIKGLLSTQIEMKKQRRGRGLDVTFADKRHTVTSNRQQMLTLLLSTYENAVIQNRELIKTKRALESLNKELKKNLHELHVSQERFRSLVMTIPDIIYRVDTAGRFIFLNDAVQKLGYEPEELIGKPFSEIILPPDVESVSRLIVLPKYVGKITGDKNAPKLFDERRTGKRKTTGLEIRLAVKGSKGFKPGLIEPLGKEVIVVEVNSSGMYEINPNTKEKVFIGTVGVIRDISERKKTEKALRDAQEELVRKENLAMLGQLAGGVGHELRNPLGAIKNATYFLNMALEDPEPQVKEAVGILDKEVTTSEKIITSLLDFAQRKPPSRGKVDVNEVVQKALSRTTVPENVEVVSQLDEPLPTIMADPDELCQAFGNIILNAIQAMTSLSSVKTPEGGTLTIKTKVDSPQWVAVSFTDTGGGISREKLGKIFEPLFTTRAKGIGLGLALAKTLVEGHGGTIEVENPSTEFIPREAERLRAGEVGRGSTFTVKLPYGLKIED
jgi:PAS domain S-box-containing protein